MKNKKIKTTRKKKGLSKLTRFTTRSLSNVLSNYKRNKEIKKIKAIKFEKLAEKNNISKKKKILKFGKKN